jgi:hypothetical protein
MNRISIARRKQLGQSFVMLLSSGGLVATASRIEQCVSRMQQFNRNRLHSTALEPSNVTTLCAFCPLPQPWQHSIDPVVGVANNGAMS